MLALRIALRNIVAHGHRSLIMIGAVGLVSCIVFLFLAFSDGEIENFKKGTSSYWNPPYDLRAQRQGLDAVRREGEDWADQSSLALRPYGPAIEALLAVSGVERARPRCYWLWLELFVDGKRFRDISIRGVAPESAYEIESQVAATAGSLLSFGERPELVLHQAMRERLGAEIGETATLAGKDLFGQVFVQEVFLAGYFLPDRDNPNLSATGFMNKAAYDLVSGFAPDESMELWVDLEKGADPEAARAAISKVADAAGLEILPGRPLDDRDADIYGLVRYIMMGATLLILLIVSVGVMSVVSSNLYDRRREIGTYYCLGAGKAFLIAVYAIEILVLNLAATALGILAGLGARAVFNGAGLRTSDPGLQLVFAGSKVALGLSWSSVLFLVAATVGLTLLTAVATLGSRLRVPPVAALRETE
ncbi:MAG: FtsX-like permease family protein [Spirochaetaceae bacterium]|nr:FtsX-like permease family protein [Spirochaetaceae bacterium]